MSDNNNRLAIWPNAKREKQAQPHLTGQGQVNSDFWVSAWFSQDINDGDKKLLSQILKRYDSKKPFISMAIKPKDDHHNSQAQQAPATQADPDFDDDIPF